MSLNTSARESHESRHSFDSRMAAWSYAAQTTTPVMATGNPAGPQPWGSSPPKRKHSTNEDGEERVIKHRSSKACRSCRTRKVRCDVSAKGSRCTNCELDNLECVVLPSRRGQANRGHRRKTLSDAVPQASGPAATRPGSGSVKSVPELLQSNSPSGASGDDARVPAVVTFDDDGENDSQIGEGANGPGHVRRDSYEALLTPQTATNATVQHRSPADDPSLPAFIRPISTRLLAEDLEYLRKKDAFAIPDTDLCLEIFKAYLFSVHPFMPMLDVEAFTAALQRDDGQISLLLFQAVMFAGLHSLRSDVVHRLGLQSPKHAREILFNRVRLLYDFNTEVDNSAILQSLLLMSSWYSKHTPWNERRHTWHWTGLAYDLARSMGLHREPGGKHVSASVRSSRRRLWWSLYIRDRMIALGTRRPMRIHDNEFDVKMLTLEDFDVQPSDEPANGLTKEENLSTAQMCIQLAELSVVIGKVVSSQYTTLCPRAGASHTMMVMPRRDGDHTKELEDCEKELQAWFDGLSRHLGRSEASAARKDPQSCSEIHWAQLNITYLTVGNVLHRAQALQSQSEDQNAGSASRLKVKNAARSITRLSQDMLAKDQVRYLSLIGVTALLAACLTHMLDVGSADEDVRDASTFRLYQSLQVLQSLREVYASADSAFSFLASVTRKAGIYLPIGADAPAAVFMSVSPRDLASGRTPSISHQPFGSTGSISAGHDRARGQHDAFTNNDPRAPSRHVENVAQGESNRFDAGQRLSAQSMPQHSSTVLGTDMTGFPTSGGLQGHGAAGTGDDEANTQFHNAEHGGSMDISSEGTLLDWNNIFATELGPGSMPFNYDFFSDAFGFLDGDMHGM